MSDSVRPHRWHPTRLPRPWVSPGKSTGVGCHFLLQCMKVKVNLLSRVQPSATPRTAAYQAPPSMGFSRQEYWSGVPLPSPMTNLDSILKSRDITWPTKVCLVKAMVFPVVMYGCESWTIKKAMTTHSSTLAWKIPWTKEPGKLQSIWLLKVGTTERVQFHFSLSCFGEGNGNPLQCSCLENPRDGGA